MSLLILVLVKNQSVASVHSQCFTGQHVLVQTGAVVDVRALDGSCREAPHCVGDDRTSFLPL